MKKIQVNEIKERQVVESTFLVREKTIALAKNGKPYMILKLMDRTGEVEGRVWDRVDDLAALFEKNDFITVYSKANVYLGKLQLVIQDLRKCPEDDLDLSDFLPVSKRTISEMRSELNELLGSLTDRHISALLHHFFDDPDFFTAYSRAPAAKGMHHVYLGGLLEHSLAVAALARNVAALYPQVNRDLLLCGALLHDVGKVAELSYQRSFDYTDSGKLLGHIIIGVEMVTDGIRQLPDFPQDLAIMIKHLLLSHHGQYEFGSPKRPKFLEAVVLNFIDDLDSKINGILSHIEKEPENQGSWTAYHRLYDRYFYKPDFHTPAAAGPTEEAIPPRHEKKPQPMEQKNRTDYSKPLGATLAEQLKGKNLDLFSAVGGKGE